MVDAPRAGQSDVPLGNRLLVVDDEPSIGRLVSKLAEGMGFEVVVTEDPAVFAKAAREWHPSVINLDLKLPGTDGIELLRGLAADNCLAQIVLTSAADDKVLEVAQQLGRDRGLNMGARLHKPIRIETMEDILREFKLVPKTLLSDDPADGIAAGQLFLEYQPKLDCRLGQITGVEALVRWRHPVHGVVQPDRFVALAEESDLIRSLTDWVVVRRPSRRLPGTLPASISQSRSTSRQKMSKIRRCQTGCNGIAKTPASGRTRLSLNLPKPAPCARRCR